MFSSLTIVLATTADRHTVSGLSSGAFMAVQHHVAWSADVSGVGAIAGGPFFCANDNAIIAQTACMATPALIDVNELVLITHSTFVSGGFIDDPRNLADARVWLFSGTADTEVVPGVVNKLGDYYLRMGVAPGNLVAVMNVSAAHAQPTLAFGNDCSYFGPPYMNACGFSAAGELLSMLLADGASPPLKPPSATHPPSLSQLISFSQRKYASAVGLWASGLGDVGYAYVPAACEAAGRALQAVDDAVTSTAHATASCRIHVVYHGCHQDAGVLNTTFVWNAGYNEWAEPNSLVIIYPQSRVSQVPFNPKGCWDWWGYTGPAYASKIGLQLQATRRMVQAAQKGLSKSERRWGSAKRRA
eukprot:CAMPEP_0115862734 /NCGR_PEP_ID=MMETSP0287-20121206/18330_1 /TAXON_ID=412157 /ORGANISM="Chrysochromulina rotalis, Strain UIO044" /LENGTH=357 /DNA_ID=CAMNT_0003317167 /DNA_START=61 /DNA_END=1134 /DNA_ORIENTATION=-